MKTLFWDCSDLADFVARGRPFTGVQKVSLGLLEALAADESLRLAPFRVSPVANSIEGVDLRRLLDRTDGLGAGWFARSKLRRKMLRAARRLFGRESRLTPGLAGSVTGETWVVCPRLKSSSRHFELVRSAFRAVSPRVKFAVFVHDMRPMDMPETSSARVRERYPAVFANACECADAVFSVSASTSSAIARFQPAAAAKVRRLVIGVSPAPPAASDAPPAPYLVYVSSVMPHKNHALAVESWKRAFAAADNAPALIFAGHAPEKSERALRELVAGTSLRTKLRFIRGADDGQVAALIKHSLFFMFPSVYEGWGLPVSEGLALGKFGVVSSSTSLPEAGGAFVEYCPPDDVAAWAAALRRYASAPRRGPAR